MKLVAYFSCSGNTKKFAQKLVEEVKGDLFEIVPTELYTEDDLNWMNPNSRSTIEMKDSTSRPSIKNKIDDISKYDTIYVGFPIWWGKAPTIINTFLESYDLSGKTIIPFGVYHSSGIGESDKYLKPSCGDAIYVNATGFQQDDIDSIVKILN